MNLHKRLKKQNIKSKIKIDNNKSFFESLVGPTKIVHPDSMQITITKRRVRTDDTAKFYLDPQPWFDVWRRVGLTSQHVNIYETPTGALIRYNSKEQMERDKLAGFNLDFSNVCYVASMTVDNYWELLGYAVN